MNCPKCQNPVEQSGELSVDNVEYRVFQCDESACNVTLELDGESFPAAYTFVANDAGKCFDPETMSPIGIR